jgi:hypothetical protein
MEYVTQLLQCLLVANGIPTSPAKRSPLLTFGEPLVKSTGFPCVKFLEIWSTAINQWKQLHPLRPSFTEKCLSQVSISRRHTRQWRNVCMSRTTVLKCGWHFDTHLLMCACKINSDWIITITAGVFCLARVNHMTCLYTRFTVSSIHRAVSSFLCVCGGGDACPTTPWVARPINIKLINCLLSRG